MTLWVRFEREGQVGFGTLEGEVIAVHDGSSFASPKPTGDTIALSDVKLLRPCEPTKMIGLWNNFYALAEKMKSSIPEEPLYFLKNPIAFSHPGATVHRPASYDGKVVFEGELGIVIGQKICNGSEAEAEAAIFGFTCVNDMTAADLISKDPSFAQWTRAKGFDGFGPFGPAIATGLDSSKLVIRTVLNGEERQNYPISDMVFPPAKLVSRISRDMSLLPGDIISCGTSIGVGSMRKPKNIVEIEIAGIGILRNEYINAAA